MTVIEHSDLVPGPAPAAVGPRRLLSRLRTGQAITGGVMLAVVVLAGLLAPLLAPHGPAEVHFDAPFQLPGTVGFALGTDDLGRDVLSRMMYGIRASLMVGIVAVGLAVVVGTPLGLAAGYWRWLDAPVSRLTDVTLAFPFLILAVGLAAINGPSLAGAAISLGIAQVPTMVRVVRAETMRLKESPFVLAATAMDASGPRILGQHILPNCLSAIIVQATVIMPAAVLGEAVLSFLGLGIQPPTPSLGIMLSDAQQYLGRAPTAALFPGLAIVAICLGFNLLGDALRDALDPSTDRK
ncbi:ABC transporter permease [Promicromonospora sukumoe]|uniref:Peptide/nickel transport system permease protein n=1 Tax=Promicromonospora sukumoe TaxID=88382 RepID=A0A7W3JBU9_9MICO|nr:ABC transporter permease [Promicromonospora sukumoe]MBA8809972.1 peptide/nickel transport system permease protein [Promicromonospora sukumoe]